MFGFKLEKKQKTFKPFVRIANGSVFVSDAEGECHRYPLSEVGLVQIKDDQVWLIRNKKPHTMESPVILASGNARDLYKKIVAEMAGGEPLWKSKPFLKGALACAISIFLVSLLTSPASSRAPKEDLGQVLSAAQSPDQTVGPIQQASPPQEAQRQASLKAMVASLPAAAQVESGLTKAAPEKTLYVWSDPTCPHCQVLEDSLAKLTGEYSIHVMPTPVRGPESDDLAARVMCSTNRNDAWSAAMHGQPVDAKPTAKCAQMAGFNRDLFRKAGFNATPTIVDGNGRMAIGEMTPDEIRAWSKQPALDSIN